MDRQIRFDSSESLTYSVMLVVLPDSHGGHGRHTVEELLSGRVKRRSRTNEVTSLTTKKLNCAVSAAIYMTERTQSGEVTRVR
jgi:hypothetical protein